MYTEKTNKNELIEQADFFAQNCFDILGSSLHCFTQIPWHTDIRLQPQYLQADAQFEPHVFYKDIKIQAGEDNPSIHAISLRTQDERLFKDIKVPWELSRFHHLYVLGQAYELTGDERYVRAFANQVTDWLDNNPYLFGVNWMNPMEVALRAINWIMAAEFFKHDTHISPDFWQRFVCSLYDHMMYLENNWELYDGRTNNHYLSNLIGYWYLCWFFQDVPGMQKKRDWCYRQLLAELDWQVFDEGTSYEGSTYYHMLVTELFMHMHLLCEEFGLELPVSVINKLQRMHDFINWCTPVNGKMIAVGDNDSGHVLYFGLPVCTDKGKDAEHTYYPSFGLSIIKTNRWHITLRHHAYRKRQPSGHFHNDVASITIAINGVPIIVDPGSYVYTASSYWRNYFRSVQQHNTFFLEGIEPVPLGTDLFALAMPESKHSFDPVLINNHIIIKTEHDLYARYGLCAQRKLDFDKVSDRLIITDQWLPIKNANYPDKKTAWNFTLAPEIEAHYENNCWLLSYQGTVLIRMQSDTVSFTRGKTWVSTNYGTKIRSSCLQAQHMLMPDQSSAIIFF